jgi:hypothetical protein
MGFAKGAKVVFIELYLAPKPKPHPYPLLEEREEDGKEREVKIQF